jgi:hypothetical protein
MTTTRLRAACLIALLALGACSNFKPAREAAACTGTPFALNAGLWTPTAEDLAE